MANVTGWVKNFSTFVGLPEGVVVTLGLLVLLLAIGTVIRLVGAGWWTPQQRVARLGSLFVWWVLVVVVAGSLMVGRSAVALVMAVAGLVGLREMLALTWEGRHNRTADPLAYLAVAVQFFLAARGDDLLWLAFLPTGMFLIIALRLVLTGTTVGYLHDFSTLFWGMMVTGYLISHAVALVHLPRAEPATWTGWLLYLLVLTEGNDIAQALWGRRFGRHRVTPTISPNKTWEGLLFGILTTVIAAVALAPLLTPLSWSWALVAGLLIAVSGFFGDINMSALKRDVGVKDSSRLLPGQGGMLDRIDSLSFSAPVFYYFAKWVTSGGTAGVH